MKSLLIIISLFITSLTFAQANKMSEKTNSVKMEVSDKVEMKGDMHKSCDMKDMKDAKNMKACCASKEKSEKDMKACHGDKKMSKDGKVAAKSCCATTGKAKEMKDCHMKDDKMKMAEKTENSMPVKATKASLSVEK